MTTLAPILPLDAECPASGWNPGQCHLNGTPDPVTVPNPGDMIKAVGPSIKDALMSSAGAILLCMVGVYALIKGWQWYTAMFRKPRQLTLF